VRVLRLLALRRLRLQPLRALLAAVVVGGGTSLLVTILVLTTSLTGSVNDAARALAGPAPLRVLGPLQRGGVSPEDLAAIRGADGVAAVVPLIQSITEVDPGGRAGRDDEIPVTILGFDCNVQELFGELDQPCDQTALAASRTPLLGAKLAQRLHDGAAVRTNLGRLPLGDAVGLPALDRINDGDVVALPMPLALQQLGRGDRVDVAYVIPDTGASVAAVRAAVQDRLPEDHRVLDALDPPPAVGVVLSTFVPLFTIIALLTLGIGAVLVRNSVTLSLEERRRQTAIVGALGGSRGLLVGGTLAEVGVLGAVGGALGVVIAVVLAHPVGSGIDEILRDVAGVPLHITVPGTAVAAGILLGVLVALGSALGPARRAVKIDVAAELASRGRREESLSATSPWRLLGGLLLLLGGAALAHIGAIDAGIERWRSQLAPVGFLVAAIGAVLLVAVAVPMLLAVLERRLPFRRAPARLALSNLRREPRRSAVMAVALGFAMGVGFITSSFKASVTEAITESLDQHLTGVEVSSIDPSNSAANEARLGPDLLARLGRLPGVASISTQGYVILGNQAGDLLGVQAFTDVWSDQSVAAGRYSKAGLDAGKVAIGPALARSRHLRPGDDLVLATPTGRVRLPIMSVMYDGSFAGRNVLMSYEQLVRLYGPQQPVSVVVERQPGVDEAELIATIRRAQLDPHLHIEGHQAVVDRNADQVKAQLSTFDAIQRGLLAMSFVAVLSTLLLVGVQRQRELGMLAAVGMTPPELRRMVLGEAAWVAVLGVVVTGGAALVMYFALNSIVPVIIGYRDPFVVDGGAYVVYSLVAVASAVLAALYPAHRAAKVEVLEALRYE
jgi:putative ABC transport system permease protein